MLLKLILSAVISIPAFAAPIFHTDDCHPRFKSSCPLAKNFQSGTLLQRATDNLIVSYQDLKAYYDHVSNGLIFENTENFELQDSKYRPLKDQNKHNLTFKINMDRMLVIPQQDLSAETVGKLFRFNFKLFSQKMNKSGFLASKIEYFNQTRYSNIKQRFEKEIFHLTDWKSHIHPPIQNLDEVGPLKTEMASSPFREKDYHSELDTLTDTELTAGNEVELMVNNYSYHEKIKMIEGAKKYIFLAVMSFAPSENSHFIINALVNRAKAGVDVRVITEGVWTMLAFKKTIKALRKGGVKVALANDLLRFGRNQGLFHSKYLVVDGTVGVVGGQNLVERSHLATGYNHYNKDTDVKVRGPVITDLMSDYILLWERFTKESFPLKYKEEVYNRIESERLARKRGSENYINWLEHQKNGLCRFISQGPHSNKYKISQAYQSTFERMERNLIYTSQHIGFKKGDVTHPDWSTKIYQTLFRQAREGKKINLITNGIDGGFLKTPPKGNFLDIFSKKINDISGYLNTMLRRKKLVYVSKIENFQVWQHFQYIHSKVALVDNEVAAIGSYNFETYSAEHSHETALFCQDQGLSQALYRDLNTDMANSTPLVLTKR